MNAQPCVNKSLSRGRNQLLFEISRVYNMIQLSSLWYNPSADVENPFFFSNSSNPKNWQTHKFTLTYFRLIYRSLQFKHPAYIGISRRHVYHVWRVETRECVCVQSGETATDYYCCCWGREKRAETVLWIILRDTGNWAGGGALASDKPKGLLVHLP